MQPTPPQWPDRPPQTPGVRPPRPRSSMLLGVAAIGSAVLIVALIGTLIVILQRGAQNSAAIGELQNGSAATASAAAQNTQQTVSATTSPQDGGNSTPAPTTSGNNSSPTATPTPPKPSVHQVSNTTILSGSQTGPAPANCPSGEIALSGGWSFSGDPIAAPLSSFRTSSSNWDVYATHSVTVSVKTYVECLRNAHGASVTERKNTGIVAPKNVSSAIASCNSGEVAVGGGFGGATGLEMYNLKLYSSTQWYGSIENHNGGSTSSFFDVYAECLTYSNASVSATQGSQVSVLAGASDQVVSVSCPSGQYVSGGGYVYGADASIYLMQATNNNTAWKLAVNANGGRDVSLYDYAVCLHL